LREMCSSHAFRARTTRGWYAAPESVKAMRSDSKLWHSKQHLRRDPHSGRTCAIDGGISRRIAMIVVHHLNDSRSQRILWLLEELGCEYTVKRYQRDPKTLLAPPGLRAVHPLGKSPV